MEKIKELIKNKDFTGLKEYKESKIKRSFQQYHRGFLTKEELKQDVMTWLYKDLNETLDYLCIGNGDITYNDRLMLIDDYNNWLVGKSVVGAWSRLNATEVIESLNALYIAPCLLKRVNPDYPCPTLPLTFYTSGKMQGIPHRIPFECVDDGGMFTDEKPTGKAYILKNSNGIEAHLCVWDVCKKGNNYEYQCTGSIDDYYIFNNDESKANIIVEVDDNKKIVDFIVKEMCVDGIVTWHTDFPRWKDYNDAVAAIQQEQKAYIEELINGNL